MPDIYISLSPNTMQVSYQKEVQFEQLEPEMQLLMASMIDHLSSLPLSVQRSFRHELSVTLSDSFGRDF